MSGMHSKNLSYCYLNCSSLRMSSMRNLNWMSYYCYLSWTMSSNLMNCSTMNWMSYYCSTMNWMSYYCSMRRMSLMRSYYLSLKMRNLNCWSSKNCSTMSLNWMSYCYLSWYCSNLRMRSSMDCYCSTMSSKVAGLNLMMNCSRIRQYR
jgi:hypothetical protein